MSTSEKKKIPAMPWMRVTLKEVRGFGKEH